MLFYLLALHAAEYCIIYNKNFTPFNSTEKFENARNRLLYEILTDYTNGYENAYSYIQTTKSILSYISKQKENKRVNPTIDEIKLLLITDIIYKFRIGEFHIGMLDLAKEYDEDLLTCWKYLSQHGLDQIDVSVEKTIITMSENDLKIIECTSYILLAYMNIVYEMILFQKNQNRWVYRKGNAFEHEISKIVPGVQNTFDYVFKRDGCIYTEIHFDLDDLFTMEPNILYALEWLSRDHGKPLHILAVYEYYEVLDACKRNHNPSLNELKEFIQETFANNSNFLYIRWWIIQLKKHSNLFDRFGIDMSHRPAYLTFCVQELAFDASCTIIKWKEKVLIAESQFDLIVKLVDEYVNYLYTN